MSRQVPEDSYEAFGRGAEGRGQPEPGRGFFGHGGDRGVQFGLCPDSLSVDSFRLQAIQEATSEAQKITRQSLPRRSNL